MDIIIKRLVTLTLLHCAALVSGSIAQAPPISARPLSEIGQWSEADQAAWLGPTLDRGVLTDVGDYLTVLVMSRSSVAVPLIERKIEEVLKSGSPAACFSDRSVDPKRFIGLATDLVAYAGDENALRAISKLMEIDEERFGPLVGTALWHSYASPRNPLSVAYSGFKIGDPAVSRRIADWVEALLTSTKSPTAVARLKQEWADAMVDKYGGAPTDLQWATDPIASRLKPQFAETLHNDMIRLTMDALQKRTKK
jgi:hypothetical protein